MLKTLSALKAPAVDKAAKRMTGLAPTIDAIALDTDLPLPNTAVLVTDDRVDVRVSGTVIVAPSTHVNPEVEIARATHVVGALMTGKACSENNLTVSPSGAVTTTANLTWPEVGAPLESRVNSPTSTECPDASYV